MPLNNYGVLKGAIAGHKRAKGKHGHYQIHLVAGGTHYRVALNVRSRKPPSELLVLLDEDFDHPLLDHLPGVREGFTPLRSAPEGMALDYIRGNLFNPARMRRIPHDGPGPDDLNDRLDYWVARTGADPGGRVLAVGEHWGPDPHNRDRHFRFHPGCGMHDLHMNQGNDPQYADGDGPWQDGGMLLHLPAEGRWVALFLAFQSQSWHTEDATGHRLPPGGPPVLPAEWAATREKAEPRPGEPCVESGAVRIVAALVNPIGGDPGSESVTLVNTLPDPVDLTGWTLADSARRHAPLDGITLPPGGAARVPLDGTTILLSNRGGTITLLDPAGFRVHGVAYTAKQARREGWSLVF